MDAEKNMKRQFTDYNDRDYSLFLMNENKYLLYQEINRYFYLKIMLIFLVKSFIKKLNGKIL